MKIVKYLSLALLALATASCEKHEIEYNAATVPSDCAMVQLHYMVPSSATTQNRIYKIDLDGTTYVNNNASLMAVYGYTPGVTKYYSVKAGSVDLKLYYGFWEDRLPEEAPDGVEEFYTDDYDKMELVYSNTISGLQAGKKYQVVIHDFNSAPSVIESTFTLKETVEGEITENTTESHYVNLYNFMYETEGVPYQGKLQYLHRHVMDWEAYYAYQDLSDEEKEEAWDGYSDWVTVGSPIGFGEATGWVKLSVIKETYNSGGTGRAEYRLIDEAGNDLQVMNAKGNYDEFSDYWSTIIGIHDHHFLRGFRSDKTVRVGVTCINAY